MFHVKQPFRPRSLPGSVLRRLGAHRAPAGVSRETARWQAVHDESRVRGQFHVKLGGPVAPMNGALWINVSRGRSRRWVSRSPSSRRRPRRLRLNLLTKGCVRAVAAGRASIPTTFHRRRPNGTRVAQRRTWAGSSIGRPLLRSVAAPSGRPLPLTTSRVQDPCVLNERRRELGWGGRGPAQKGQKIAPDLGFRPSDARRHSARLSVARPTPASHRRALRATATLWSSGTSASSRLLSSPAPRHQRHAGPIVTPEPNPHISSTPRASPAASNFTGSPPPRSKQGATRASTRSTVRS